ncbi:Pirin-like protein [Neobacillus bataviensis LMG 21833]|uniref:Pirin-like protein n=1 Tax=Neobacillus bataviensis LMG 21833 TaxID=1117379 RepID=K6DCW1_9BACI|nr:pirin family protein [Neobacillus bataviensis]EKN70372.1 Pirin-like protein [Neobacillus bataviensis LMG 21833]
MIQITPSDKRFSAKSDWLESHFSFSFGSYYDEENIHFGPLRVLNDDIIQPGKGFGIHPHRDAEIVSIVLKGQLKHEDSLKNVGILKFGDIQRMTAGTGVLHSEFNPTSDEETHILQLWFMPNKKQLSPSYEDISFDTDNLHNKLLPIVSSSPVENAAMIHQDVTLYLSKLDSDKELHFQQEAGRKIYLFIIEGEISLNSDVTLQKRDDARITDLHELTLQAKQDSSFLLIDLPGGEE